MVKGNSIILKAASCYINVSSLLKPVWEQFAEKKLVNSKVLYSISKSIKQAKASEQEGIDYIKDYITNFS